MNAQSIWAGQDYAAHDYRRKGVQFQHGGYRVRAIRLFKKKGYGNERDTAYVECYRIADDGEIRHHSSGEPMTVTVRARDISMFWNEYAEELKHFEEEEARKQEEQRMVAEAKKARREEICKKLESVGFDRNFVTMSMYGDSISIPFVEIDRWYEASQNNDTPAPAAPFEVVGETVVEVSEPTTPVAKFKD